MRVTYGRTILLMPTKRLEEEEGDQSQNPRHDEGAPPEDGGARSGSRGGPGEVRVVFPNGFLNQSPEPERHGCKDGGLDDPDPAEGIGERRTVGEGGAGALFAGGMGGGGG
jgi:hypothetical protein